MPTKTIKRNAITTNSASKMLFATPTTNALAKPGKFTSELGNLKSALM